MGTLDSGLLRTVEAWLDRDPDPATRAELSALLSAGDRSAIEERFSGPLRFGTAGLRGLMGAGPNRMNRLVVRHSTAGLVAWILEAIPDARARGVVVGFDGRHGSPRFAADTAEVITGAGLPVFFFDRPSPTPLIAHATLARGAAAGVVITASHNPPAYNGYKVFWENGAQIIPPHDREIAARIDAAATLSKIPLLSRRDAEIRGLFHALDDADELAYLEAIATLLAHPELPRTSTIAYTAMHGVGERLVRRAFASAGHTHLHSVASQSEPDGDFPSVAFPNPEEPGAMDAVLALAREVDASLALANDPDADRLAVAALHSGSYVSLDGNQIGILLAHYLLEEREWEARPLVLSSIVSSPMLGAVAAAHGALFEQTLTGHKWIQNRGIELERAGYVFVFGYEEALGYAAGAGVRDKDGISAALLMAEMCDFYRSEGKTLIDELEGCYRRYGMYLSRLLTRVLDGREGEAQIAAAMGRLRASMPTELGGLSVVSVEDLKSGGRLPAADLVILKIEGGHRAMARPSGTEPKLKCYIDVRIDVDGRGIESARAEGEALLDRLSLDLASEMGLSDAESEAQG